MARAITFIVVIFGLVNAWPNPAAAAAPPAAQEDTPWAQRQALFKRIAGQVSVSIEEGGKPKAGVRSR